MKRSRIYNLFCGPTISAQAALAAFPRITILDPISHGDLIRLPLEPNDVVAIVDGLFVEKLPIRHKEIIEVLAAGVVVIGASAMGAVRAADLAGFGMSGIGTVYKLYKNGKLEGNDEVAVAHLRGDRHYLPLTESLVNVRATCQHAASVGILRKEEARLIVSCGKQIAYYERTYPNILQVAVASGLLKVKARDFLDQLARIRVNVQHADALRLLSHLRRRRGPKTLTAQGLVTNTIYSHEWRLQQSNRAETPLGPVSDLNALSFAQSLAVDYPQFHYRSILEHYAGFSDFSMCYPREDNEELVADFCHQNALNESLSEWLSRRGMSKDELIYQLRLKARVRALVGAGITEARDIPLEVLEEFVAHGALRRGVLGAAFKIESGWLTPDELQGLSETKRICRVLVRSFRIGVTLPYRLPLMVALKMSESFSSLVDGVRRTRFFLGELYENGERHIGQETMDEVSAWFRERWGTGGRDVVELWDRGFSNQRDLFGRAREFYLFDIYNDQYRDFHLLTNGVVCQGVAPD